MRKNGMLATRSESSNGSSIRKLRKTELGASMIEYSLLAALIAIVAIAAITFLGRSASTTFSTVGQELGNVNN